MARTVRTNGARIVQLYLEAGLTQDELAQQCGCMPSTVRKAERGGPVALSVLREIAEVLDVPFRELLAGSGGPIAGTSDAWSEGWPDRLVGSWSGRLDQPAGPGGQPFHGEFRIRFVRTAAGATAHYTFAYREHDVRVFGQCDPALRAILPA